MEAAGPPTPAKKISVGEVVNETFSIYGQNFAALILSAVVVFVIVGVVAGIFQNAGGVILVLVGALVHLIGFALYTGFVVKLVEDVRDGRRDQTAGDLFTAASPAIWSLIGFGILYSIGVFIGFILLVIPGLILITFWCVGAPAIVIERLGPIQAFGRSWRLVSGDAWSVFGTLLVVLLIVIAVGVVLGIIATSIGAGAVISASVISDILTAPVFALAISVMFFDLGGGRGAPAAATAPPPPPGPTATA